jgi:hypothetical protein
MHRSLRTCGLTILGAAAIMTLASAGTALAHGDANQGDLEMTIGFGAEPAFTGQPNSAQLALVHDGEPVTDLKPGDATVEVTYGDETSEPMDMEPAFGEPGDYRAYFTPTQPGKYTFHFTGTVDGEEIDETMTSGPTTFAEVQDLATSEFPAVDAPSGEELATRIEQESARAEQQLAVAQAEAVSAQDAASSARTVAIIGVALGALGVIAAIAALARKKG